MNHSSLVDVRIKLKSSEFLDVKHPASSFLKFDYKCVYLVAYFASNRKTLGVYIQRVERTSTKRERSASYVVCNLHLCRESTGYSVHWGTPCFMRLISMPWEPGDGGGGGGSAGGVIFAMLFVPTRTLLRPRE